MIHFFKKRSVKWGKAAAVVEKVVEVEKAAGKAAAVATGRARQVIHLETDGEIALVQSN